MYNEERKLQYLKEKSEVSILSNNIGNAFDNVEKFEEKYGRDVCEWTSSEIIDFYKYLCTPYVQTLIQLNNALSSYANWCMLNGLISDNQNHFADITSGMLCKCVDLNNLKTLVLDRETIERDIGQLNNFCDQFIILGLFEGIPVTDDVMKNVKLSDLEGNVLHLSNGNDIVVSPLLHKVMEFAAGETSWISNSEKRKIEVNYFDDGCIIRYTMKKNGDITMCSSTITIGTRLRKALKFLGWSEKITMKVIMESGRIDMMKRLADQYGVPIEETITNHKIREIHEKIYGKIQNQTTYFETFGVCLK